MVSKKLAAVAAAAVVGLVGAAAPTQPAAAARQENWRHSGSSQVSSVAVYSGWLCDEARDSVPRGTEAEFDVRSVRIPAKKSLWWVTPRGVVRKSYNPLPFSVCYTYAGRSYTGSSYNAIRNGKYWGNG